MVTVEFLDAEWVRLEQIAKEKLDWCLQHGARPKSGAFQDGTHRYNTNLCGVMGEAAVAKHFRVFWRRDGDFASPDGPVDLGGIQVRSSFSADKSLWVYKGEPDDLIYIWCVSYIARKKVDLMGWIRGTDAKKDELWRADLNRPCYGIPAPRLKPIDLLGVLNGVITEALF